MTIDSLPANLAAPSATIAQTTEVSATDGAQILTDEQGQLTAFAAIFKQLSQIVSPEASAVQTTPQNAPTLPDLPAIPPAAIAKEQLPPQAAIKHAESLPANFSLAEEPVEVEKESVTDEKPEKQSDSKCDCPEIQFALPTQPLDIQLPNESQGQPEQPVVQDDAPKAKPIRPEKISLRKAAESDDAPRNTPQKSDPKIESIQIPQELSDDAPQTPKEIPPAPDHPKLDAPKTEFTLPQAHTLQKQIDPPAPLPPTAPEQSFIQNNHPQILTTIHGQLLPNGGSLSLPAIDTQLQP